MCIPSSRGPRDKEKSSQVHPKVILVQYGVVVVVVVVGGFIEGFQRPSLNRQIDHAIAMYIFQGSHNQDHSDFGQGGLWGDMAQGLGGGGGGGGSWLAFSAF